MGDSASAPNSHCGESKKKQLSKLLYSPFVGTGRAKLLTLIPDGFETIVML